MARNLKYQLKNTIDRNFQPKMDKHSMKASAQMDATRIFSYADRTNLIDFTANLANFMKESHPEIREVTKITPEHIQDFLNQKAKNCTTETLKQYSSKFNKVERLVNDTYSSKVSWSGNYTVPQGYSERSRDIAMTREHFQALRNQIQGSRSQAVVAVELAGKFGVRVAETTKLQGRDIQIREEKMFLHIHESKGGRSRDIEVTKQEDKEFLLSLKERYQDYSRIVAIKEDSVNAFMRRNLEACGIREYTDAKTSEHAIRKMVAQERYDELRESGLSQKESLDRVSEFLGHGENRDELMSHYIHDIH